MGKVIFLLHFHHDSGIRLQDSFWLCLHKQQRGAKIGVRHPCQSMVLLAYRIILEIIWFIIYKIIWEEQWGVFSFQTQLLHGVSIADPSGAEPPLAELAVLVELCLQHLWGRLLLQAGAWRGCYNPQNFPVIFFMTLFPFSGRQKVAGQDME